MRDFIEHFVCAAGARISITTAAAVVDDGHDAPPPPPPPPPPPLPHSLRRRSSEAGGGGGALDLELTIKQGECIVKFEAPLHPMICVGAGKDVH